MRPEHIFRICSIDPGVTCLGRTIIDYDCKLDKIISISPTTYKSDKMLPMIKELVESHSERIEKIYALKNQLLNDFMFYEPNSVCCESPFYNRLMPNAFGALVEIIFAIRTSAIEYSKHVPMVMYPPSIVKKAVLAGAVSDKDAVKKAVANCKEIQESLLVDFNTLDEHSIDSIAVGYTHLCNLRRANKLC